MSAEFNVSSPMRDQVIVDSKGREVKVGTRIRLLKIEGNLLSDIPEEEAEALMSMIGEVFEVEEIDEYGSAWIGKSWQLEPEQIQSQSLALGPSEMEVVSEAEEIRDI